MINSLEAVNSQVPANAVIGTNLEVDNCTNEVSCGVGKCRPRYFQKCAHPLSFLVIYCLLGLIQGAYFTYFVGILSTLEKRFAFDSKITGIILIADNLTPILFGICVGYYGSRSHRPRMIFGGMILSALSCFISAVPYYVFGPGMHLTSRSDLSPIDKRTELCNSTLEGDCDHNFTSSTIPAVLILFIGNFFNGAGSLLFFTVGPTYLDDNIKKKDSVIYFSITIALRVLGPSIGYLISGFCLQFYEDPFYDPGFTNSDPRWIGAWWMGFLILGGLIIISSIPLIFFPSHLHSNKPMSLETRKTRAQSFECKDLMTSLKIIFTNPVLMCHTLSLVCQINGVYGYLVILPRYIENHFRQTASSASFYSGTTSMVSMMVGILFGGAIIRRFKPGPRYLLGYMVFVQVITSLYLLASFFMSCPSLKLTGSTIGKDKYLELNNDCNSNCGCSKQVFQPVCELDKVSMYFSPCFAGCTTKETGNETKFVNCTCIDNNNGILHSEVYNGFCPINCQMFFPFIVFLFITKLLDSTTRVGDVLITLRCVSPKDKSLALGATEIIVSIFATIPFPIVYGAIVDSTCILWEETCSKKGNCWLYDTDKFRYYLHGTSLVFMVFAAVLEAIVWFLSNHLEDLYQDKKRSHCDNEESLSLR